MNLLETSSLRFISFFERKKQWGKIRFSIFFAIINVLLSFMLAAFLPTSDSTTSAKYSFITAIIIAPIFETFLFQSLPFSISRRLKLKFWLYLTLMTIPFALLHYHNGYISIVNAFISGLIYGASFIVWAKDRYRDAVIAVCLIHGLHNLVLQSVMATLVYIAGSAS